MVFTWAFRTAQAAFLDSYDIELPPNLAKAETRAAQDGMHFTFHHQDVIKPGAVIPHTDLLFIQTRHNYAPLKEHLGRHGDQAVKFITRRRQAKDASAAA